MEWPSPKTPERQEQEPAFSVIEAMRSHRDEFLALLQEAELALEGDASEILGDEIIAPHSNRVLLVEVKQDAALPGHSNHARLFELFGHGLHMRCIFKPASGESPMRLREFNIARMYPRETAAYHVDYVGEFEVMPPTVNRTINDEEGSLQLFIPPHEALAARLTPYEQEKPYAASKRWKRMAMLDRLIRNADRDAGNYLVTKDGSDVLAIDHGLTFVGEIRGNDKNDAYSYFEKQAEHDPEIGKLDDDLRGCLQRLVDRENLLIPKDADDPEGERLAEQHALIEAYDVIGTAKRMLAEDTFLLPY